MFSQVYASSNVLAHNFAFWWIAQLVAIGILLWAFLRWKPGFTGRKTIGQSVDGALRGRANQIQAQLDAAQKSREEAALIHEQSRQEIDRARQQSDEIVARAAETGKAIQQEIQDRARVEYTRIVGQAKVQIEYERERAEQALRRQAADIVVEAAGQIVRHHLEPQTDRHLIVTSLENMKEI